LKKEELIEKIQSEIQYCESTILTANPTYAKTQPQYLEMIDLYMNSKYRDGDTDIFGLPKPFYNIVTLPVDVASKMVDLDTKNILLEAENENYWETWLMEKELHFWMKDKYFGTQLNEYSYILPRDGHLIVKKVGNDVQVVPIRNMRFRPDAVDFNKIPKVERHLYQSDEFVAEAKRLGWENWEKVNVKPDTTVLGQYVKEGRIPVYEIEFPDGMIDDPNNWFLVSADGHVLASAYYKESLYKAMPWDKVYGRTLGRGQVEKLFNAQIYINRMANYKAEGLYWSSKKLFQTRDNMVARNLLAETENGDVITVNDEIKAVPLEERNLGFYNYDESRWERNALRSTFTQESVTGERAPSGTPLGSSVLSAQQATIYYKQKKENLGNFVKEILYDWVLPEFQKEKRKEHDVMIKNLLTGDDNSDKFFQMLVHKELNKKKIEAFGKGKIITGDEEKILMGVIADKMKTKKMTIPKDMYEDLKYKVNIVITGEEIDTQSKLTTLQTVLQILGSNPTILQDKQTRRVFNQMLDLSGINPMNIESSDTPTLQGAASQLAQRGGSIAAPAPAGVGAIKSQTTL
jgi:hypothetical protein